MFSSSSKHPEQSRTVSDQRAVAALVSALSDAGISRAKIDAILSKTARPDAARGGFTPSPVANDRFDRASTVRNGTDPAGR